jgi:DNA adenine methylase
MSLNEWDRSGSARGEAAETVSSVKPFLKWAGGKRQLLPELLKHVPPNLRLAGRYFEPFLGGGALFFEVRPKVAVLNDINRHLIAAYTAVRDDVEGVIRALEVHQARHSRAHFDQARALIIDGKPQGTPVAAAARVIYINKTCFNGLWRINRKGEYNVPMGAYKNPLICDAVGLRRASRALQGARICCVDFWDAVKSAGKGDFIYFDPPYIPASDSANFVGYAKGGFGPTDQARLRDAALLLKAHGVSVLLTNADTEETRRLYQKGFKMRRVEARRAINSKASARGAVGELIIW